MSDLGRSWLSLWFGLARAVDRRAYALSGFGLMALKYAVDALIVWLATRRVLEHVRDQAAPASKIGSAR